MNDSPRRRRPQSDEPARSGGGIPIFPLLIVVVLLGFLLGGVIAHFRNAPAQRTAAVASATPTSEPTATFAPAATVAPSRAPSPSPSPSATATPAALALATPVRTATPLATSSKEPVRVLTPAPKASVTPSVAPKRVAAVAAPEHPVPGEPGVGGTDRAAAIVRAYLSAMARGDQSEASAYLASGSPDESFMTGGKVTSIRSSIGDDGRYKVAADLATPKGSYFETFTLESRPQGLVIVERTAIKP